jgi:hypothetical protein
MRKMIMILISLCMIISGCADMTAAQRNAVKEIAGIAIGMAVDVLIAKAGLPEKHYSPRDMDGIELIEYPDRIFYARDGIVYAVYGKGLQK